MVEIQLRGRAFKDKMIESIFFFLALSVIRPALVPAMQVQPRNGFSDVQSATATTGTDPDQVSSGGSVGRSEQLSVTNLLKCPAKRTCFRLQSK